MRWRIGFVFEFFGMGLTRGIPVLTFDKVDASRFASGEDLVGDVRV